MRLSYVKQYGDGVTEPFALLSILGLIPKAGLVKKENNPIDFTVSVGQTKVQSIKYNQFQMMDMFLCPYRYLLDYVMEDSPIIQGSFLFQKYFENLLVEAVWKRIANQERSDAEKYLDRIVSQESNKLFPYFSFWKSTEIYDLNLRATHYVLHEIIENGYGTKVKPYAALHMEIRKQFGTAKFIVDVSDREQKNPYSDFEAITKLTYPKKEYSLHKLPSPAARPTEQDLANKLCNNAMQYINSRNCNDNTAIPADWCTFCVHRGTCMQSYLTNE